MKYLFGIIMISCLPVISLKAQNWKEKKPVTIDLTYQYSLPMNDFKKSFIEDGSARGFGVDIMFWLKPGISLGGSFGYQDYYQKYPRAVYKLSDGSDISAVVSNSLQSFPLMVKASYLPQAKKAGFIQPFASVGAGVNFISYSQYLGEFGGSNSNASFTAMAGGGFKIPFKKYTESGILLGANYQFSSYNDNNLKNLNSLNFQAGFRFKLK